MRGPLDAVSRPRPVADEAFFDSIGQKPTLAMNSLKRVSPEMNREDRRWPFIRLILRAVNLSILTIWHELNTLGLMVRRRAQRAVSNHGSRFGLAAILRDALASLELLRMRSEW
jgi:hypothetical protein